MTSPDGAIPDNTYVASTVGQLQDVDQASLAAAGNLDVHASAEDVRSAFLSVVYSQIEQVPIIGGVLASLVEALTGGSDVVDDVVDGINSFIASALHALGSLLDDVPIVGSTLEEIIDNIADGLNNTHTTATAAASTATSAASTAASAASTATSAASTAASAASTASTAASTATSAASTASTANSNATTAAATANSAAIAASTAHDVAVAAQSTATVAVADAQYWTAEALVASAEVLLGLNELLIGMVMDVPTGKVRTITALHFAFVTLPGAITITTRLDGTVVHTATIPAGQLKTTYTGLSIAATDKQRVSWNVTALSGVATVMSCAATGSLV